MNKYSQILNVAKNKYFLVVAFVFVWMMFFDRYDIPSQLKMHRKIKQLEADRDFYLSGKEEIAERKKVLFSDPSELERFAREKYRMKKADEDLFIIEEK